MSESVRSEGKDSLSDVVSSPKKTKPTKETWLKAKVCYETGDFQDLKQLSIKYGLNYTYLREKASKENWKPFKLTVSNKITQKVAEKIENKVESFLNSLEKKGIYYEKLVEASQAQASRNSEGIPELEPVDLEKYARVEGLAIDWRKTALGISDKTPINVDVNLNVTAMLAKLREGKPMQVDIETEVMECKALIDGLQEG